MKRQPIQLLAVGLALLGLGISAQAGSLRANQYYTWGIDSQDLAIPEGCIITKAVLTFHDIKNWKNDGTDRLYVHLIENPPVGLSEYSDSETEDTFADDGKALQSSFLTTRLVYSLQETDDALSWVWSVFKIPFQFLLSDSSQVQYSSSLLELIDFAGTGTSFGFGIDPETRDYPYSRMTLELTVEAYEGTVAKKVLLFEVSDSPIPTALWSMDDTAGMTRITDSGSLSLHGTATRNTSSLTTVGMVSTAIAFNGISDFVSCGTNDALSTDAWSVSAWVKCNDTDTPTLISFGGFRPSIRLQNGSKGQPIIHMGSTNFRYFDPAAWTTLKDGQWHHVVFTMPGSAENSIESSAMYLDGVAVAPTITVATSPQNDKTGLFLGNTSDTGSQFFSGAMDEVAFFNRVLEDWEIELLYESTVGEAPVNQAPVLVAIGAKSVTEGDALSFTISGTDPDNDPLTYSATDLPSGATFNTTSKTFTWTPATDTAGSYNATFTVQDTGGSSDSETVTITVTAASSGDLPIPTVQWPMDDAAASLKITDSSGRGLHGMATQNTTLLTTAGNVDTAITFNGTSDFITCGSNPTLLSDAWSVSAWVKCNDTDTPTLISFGGFRPSIRLQNGSKGQPIIHMGSTNFRYFDPAAWTTLKDGQWHHVVFTMPGSAENSIESSAMYLDGVAVAPTITVATSPQNDKTGLFLGNTSDTGSQFFSGAMDEVAFFNRVLEDWEIELLYESTVGEAPINQAPVLAAIGAKSVTEGNALSFSISATDPDNNPLTYSATGLPSGSTFNATTKTFAWTPATGTANSYNVIFTVQDTGGLSDSETVTITVAAAPVNHSPVLAAIGAKSVTEGNALSFSISATDPDNNPLTYSATGLPSGSTFNATTKTFAWTPATGAAGTYNVTFRVQDSGGLNDSELVTITVTAVPVNHAPVLAAIGAKSVTEGNALSFSISATDPDNNPLTYSATGLPSGSTFNATTKTFAWTPATGTAGSYNVTFRVQDSGGLSDSETVALEVKQQVVVPTQGLVAYWGMNDAEDTPWITDNGYMGLHGIATQSTALLTTAGKVGSAITFNGTSDFISCGYFAAWLPGAWSVSAWVKCDDIATPTLISFGGLKSSARLQNNGKGPILHMGDSNYRYFSASAWTTLKDGQWHHVVFTMPGAAQNSIESAEMYVDGVAVNVSTTLATGPQNAKGSVFLGNIHATGSQYFSGAMDEVRLYYRVITAQEIQTLFAAGQ